MLSAWFRMKYPHVVAGAIAASAPVAQFEGWTSPFAFSEVVSKDFDQCADAIRRAWKVLYASSLNDIWKHLHLCEPAVCMWLCFTSPTKSQPHGHVA
jgi:lysosomal Pro-X carboxypeptidase